MSEERIDGLKRVRSQVPMSEDEFAAIRRNVVREMERGGVAHAAGRLICHALDTAIALRVAASIGLALIAVAAFVMLREPARPPVAATARKAPAAASATTTSQPGMGVSLVQNAGAATPVQRMAKAPTASRRTATRHPSAQRHQERTSLPPAAALIERIEFQTSDPDVRIIWIQSRTTEETSR